MTRVVVAASVIGGLILDDERQRLPDGLEDLFTADEVGATVPAHWLLETASMVQVALRRKRLTQSGAREALGLLRHLPIEVDGDTNLHVLDATWQLGLLHNLTVYDAAYLELALRLRVPIATNDGALIAAARCENLEVFGR